MIFIAAVGVVTTTVVVVSVAVAAHFTDLMTPTPPRDPNNAEEKADQTPCTAHLLPFYQQ